LSTSTLVDRNVVAALTEANPCLAKQLEERPAELKAIIELLEKERAG
jgi:hypothetical protein